MGNKEEEITTWTDREAEGAIIGLKIRTRRSYGYVTQLKSLHGSQWSNWRDVGYEPNDDDQETELVLRPGDERINCIRTWSDSDGRLCCIEVTTTQGRQFSAGDKRGQPPSHHLENGQKLAYISGATSEYKRSLTFHW